MEAERRSTIIGPPIWRLACSERRRCSQPLALRRFLPTISSKSDTKRRCDERNHSGKDRVNVLHAVARGGVCKPMIDMTVEAAAFLASTIPAEITARELRDVRRLVVDAHVVGIRQGNFIVLFL